MGATIDRIQVGGIIPKLLVDWEFLGKLMRELLEQPESRVTTRAWNPAAFALLRSDRVTSSVLGLINGVEVSSESLRIVDN